MQTASPSKRAKLTIRNLVFRSTLYLVVCAGTIACGGDDGPGPTPTEYEPLGPDVSLESVELSATELAPGERLRVLASLINRGDRSGEFVLNLEIDGETYLSQQRYVRPPQPDDEGANELDVELAWAPQAEGSYAISVNGLDAGQVRVSAPGASIDVVAAGIEDGGLATDVYGVGEPLIVFAQAQNMGATNAELVVALEVDGEAVSEEVVFVSTAGVGGDPAATAQRVEFAWTPLAEGLYELSVNGVDAGQARVASPPEVTLTASSHESGDFLFIREEAEFGGWFVDVDFVGTALDALDGALSGEALQWSTRADENDDGIVTTRPLGQGDALTARLYMAKDLCGALTEHVIVLEATNSAGLTNSAYHRVILRQGRC